MFDSHDDKNGKKKTGLGTLILTAVLLLGTLAPEDSRVMTYMVMIVLFAAFLAVVIRGIYRNIRKHMKGEEQEDKRSFWEREDEEEYPEPEAHCVVCENTGEDHFDRDRHQRLEQLDEWRKNGLIDAEEYKVLKERFENDR